MRRVAASALIGMGASAMLAPAAEGLFAVCAAPSSLLVACPMHSMPANEAPALGSQNPEARVLRDSPPARRSSRLVDGLMTGSALGAGGAGSRAAGDSATGAAAEASGSSGAPVYTSACATASVMSASWPGLMGASRMVGLLSSASAVSRQWACCRCDGDAAFCGWCIASILGLACVLWSAVATHR